MRLLIIDDDKLVCMSLKIILEADKDVQVIGVGHDGSEAIKLYDELNPDIMLMDIRMKEVTGLTAAETILSKHPEARILFLTTFSDDEYIVKAFKYGVKGYLLKQDYDNILPAIHAVLSGQSVFGDEVIAKIPSLILTNNNKDFSFTKYGLSNREAELIKLVSDGLSNKEIADSLFLSEGTIRNYLSIILEKLQLRDRTQLAVFYYKHL